MNIENDKKENEKKEYVKPTVQKVEFDFSEVITASGCEVCPENIELVLDYNKNLW